MQVVFNPKDTNTFASASLDRTVKVRDLKRLDPADHQGVLCSVESTLSTPTTDSKACKCQVLAINC